MSDEYGLEPRDRLLLLNLAIQYDEQLAARANATLYPSPGSASSRFTTRTGAFPGFRAVLPLLCRLPAATKARTPLY